MKKHSQIILLAIFLCAAFLNLKCKNEPTQPKDNTPDTTSHNFIFQQFAFGGNAGSSYFNDVSIINDTLAYAVGAVYFIDSTTGQPDPLPYNLAKWNGYSWQLKKVTVQTIYGSVTMPLDGIFTFSSDDIWLVAGDPIHGDGKNWSDFDIRNITGDQNIDVLKGWGTSSSNIYFVGRNGNIVHYNGSSWTKIESGATLPINDIYGAWNSQTNQWEILAVASNKYLNVNKKVLQITPSTATAIPDSGLSWSIKFCLLCSQ